MFGFIALDEIYLENNTSPSLSTSEMSFVTTPDHQIIEPRSHGLPRSKYNKVSATTANKAAEVVKGTSLAKT